MPHVPERPASSFSLRLLLAALPLAAALRAQTDTPVDLPEATIAELRAAMQSGLLTAEGLAERCRARVAAYDRAGPDLRSILALNPDLIREARQRDREAYVLGGIRGPLHGIPVLLKDNIDALPMPTTAGSVALANSFPPDDSFLAQRLRAAGAVVFGKAGMTEFANFMTTGMPAGYSSLGGAVANPYDPRRDSTGLAITSPGGSSAGSGAAVAANLVAVAIGTETSGSILSPASSNGVVGIKPTLGLVSRDGILPITADQDTAGPMARTVEDAARVLGVIAGFDPNDPETIACQTPGNCFADYTQFLDRTALQGARIAVVPPQFGPSSAQAQILQTAVATLNAAGAVVANPYPIANPNVGDICIVHPPPAGQSTVMIFGFKRDLNGYLAGLGPNAPMQSLAQIIAHNNANAPIALRFGQSILVAADRYDTTPNSADDVRYRADRQRDLTNTRASLDAVYDGPDGVRGTSDDFDAILWPGPLGSNWPARAGYPSISVPGGTLGSTGVPYGVTFSGRAFSEPRLIALAYAFEQATGHRSAPASTPALATDRIPFQLAGVRTLGSGCGGANGVPTIATLGPPILANSTFRIAHTAMPPNTVTVLMVSLQSNPRLISPCFLYPAEPALDVLWTTSDGAGAATFALPIPWFSSSGTQIYVQGGALEPAANPAGLVVSRALAITIGG